MLKNIIRGGLRTLVRYQLAYDDGHGNGYGFPCDADGAVRLRPEAEQNYSWCRQHPEAFVRAGEVVTIRQRYREPDRGTCACGETVELTNEYHGACQCPGCGRWYNLFGESLLPPDQWGMKYEDEYAYS